MKFGVVVFPGSNCDHDMLYVLSAIEKQEVVRLWHKESDLQNCDMIVLPVVSPMETIFAVVLLLNCLLL